MSFSTQLGVHNPARVIYTIKVACIAFIVVLLTSCAAEGIELPASSKKFVPGYYEAVISGSRKATINIDEELNYEYVEDSTRNGVIKQVFRNGQLRFSTWRNARAGNIKLEWLSPFSIRVQSPYSSTIGHGNNVGNESYSSGPFLTGMPNHVFVMTKRGSE